MNGYLPTTASKRRSTPHPISRWAFILMVILLAFSTSGAGQTPKVQAAQYDVNINIWIEATQVGAQHTICVDDKVEFRVRVLRQVEVNILSIVRPLPNVDVKASVNGAGSITPTTKTISATSGAPGSGIFTFTAKEVGTAIVVFSAQVDPSMAMGVPLLGIGGYKVETHLEVKVEDCKYKLHLASIWRVPGEVNVTISARIDIAGLVEEVPSYYKGIARVQWRATMSGIGDCTGTLSPDSQATVTANANRENQQLTVNFEYDAAEVKMTAHCEADGESTGGDMTFIVAPESFVEKTLLIGGIINNPHHGLETPAGKITTRTYGWISRINNP